jgi:nicotinate-nucleotide adenylyltransferase
MSSIGIFGGTFDPIHYGHLRSAFELLHALQLSEVRFVPAGDPPHRGTTFATAEFRLRMVQLAVQDRAGFVVDDRELRRGGPSYTVTTLEALRAEFFDVSLCLIVGMDAFLGLTTWHRWDEIPNLAHIIVAHRPGWQAPDSGDLGELIAARKTQTVADLHEQRFGHVFIHAVTQLEIASTKIRELIAHGRDPRFLMPDPVRDLILESGCYTLNRRK